MVMLGGCAQRLFGRSVGGDTTCLNAAFLVARLTFSVSRWVFLLPYFFWLRERKSVDALPDCLYTLFLLRALLCVLGVDIDVEIKRKLYLQIEYHSLLLQEGGRAKAHSDGKRPRGWDLI